MYTTFLNGLFKIAMVAAAPYIAMVADQPADMEPSFSEKTR
jgi:hypothetical protein